MMHSVRSLASTNSRQTAKMMVQSAAATHSPTVYTVGNEVLVRWFSSTSRKKSDLRGLVKRQSRVVKGTITKKKKCSQYKVRYQFNGRVEEKWYSVSDITSVTYEKEKIMRSSGNSKYVSAGIINRNTFYIGKQKLKTSTGTVTQPSDEHDFESDLDDDLSLVEGSI